MIDAMEFATTNPGTYWTQPMGLDMPPPPRAIPRRRNTEPQVPHAGADCVRLSGVLTMDAYIRFQAGTANAADNRRAWLVARLMLPGGLFVDVAQDAGTTATQHHAAQARCRHLRTGARVTAWAKGAITATKHGVTVLVLLLPQLFIDTAPAPAEAREGATT